MTEKVFRKTVEVIERPDATSTAQKTFSTEPKTRRRIRHSISGSRAKEFMQHLWRKNLRKCSYHTLKFEFILFFETNDPRVYEKYIGCPKEIIRYPGASVVRQNRNSGKIAYFMYSNQRTKQAKLGLMEILGYITFNRKTAKITLHHERMSYYTKQTTLENIGSPPKPPLHEIDEESSQKCSKDNLCVCRIEAGESEKQHVLSDGIEVEKKKEEEVIDCTHKSGLL